MRPKTFLLITLFAALGAMTSLVRAAGETEAQTVSDPAVPKDHLALRLDPLTVDELAAESEAWLGLVEEKAKEVSSAEIAARSSDAGQKSQLLGDVSRLAKEKDALLERFEIVLDAHELKGGDVESMRKYAAAVGGIKADVTDVESTWFFITDWLKSEDGGIRWAINIGKFIGIMVVFWILAGLISRITDKALGRSPRLTELLKSFIRKMVRRVVLVIGLIVALGTVGVNVGAALALIGGGAFVLAFALQDTLSNFANGMMLLLYRPFDVGDAVEIGGVTGKVDDLSLVSTTILTFDNKKVLVPNKNVWGQVITNITGMPTRRVDMVFGIGYDDDIEEAQSIIERVVDEHELVLKDPAPVIKLNELADSSVNFICRPWSKTSDYLTVLSDVTKRVKKEFDAAGISIPYPQRDVHLHTVTPPSDNDAA